MASVAVLFTWVGMRACVCVVCVRARVGVGGYAASDAADTAPWLCQLVARNDANRLIMPAEALEPDFPHFQTPCGVNVFSTGETRRLRLPPHREAAAGELDGSSVELDLVDMTGSGSDVDGGAGAGAGVGVTVGGAGDAAVRAPLHVGSSADQLQREVMGVASDGISVTTLTPASSRAPARAGSASFPAAQPAVLAATQADPAKPAPAPAPAADVDPNPSPLSAPAVVASTAPANDGDDAVSATPTPVTSAVVTDGASGSGDASAAASADTGSADNTQ